MSRKQNSAVELSAVIAFVAEGRPFVCVKEGPSLPSGPLETGHRTLEQALRAWVAATSDIPVGYVEQLYTFADKDRLETGRRIVSIGYLALSGPLTKPDFAADWYGFFPWEDHRAGFPADMLALVRKHLSVWESTASSTALRRTRRARINLSFPKNARDWNEELVLQRYELLWEAGLLEEASRGGKRKRLPLPLGRAMTHDHRRILATAIARLRAKIKYRPVVFELMPPRFTLLQLQETVEALAGLRLHKQNFRRLVLSQGLVEETRGLSRDAKGRPAKLFSFKREVLLQRALAGTKLPRSG